MKKKSIFIIVILVILIIFSFVFFNIKKSSSEKTNVVENQFNVDKIHLYSDVSAVTNSTTYQNPEWSINVYQYTDIALYIDRINEYSSLNSIKRLYINNIEISNSKLGMQKIFYLNPLEYGKSDIVSNEPIEDIMEYNILNEENKENDLNYSIPICFEDLSNPITLKYVNSDILKNYKIESSEKLNFNGNILKSAKINLEDINAKIKFDVNIVTADTKIHINTVQIDIPLEDSDKQIYDGGIYKIYNKLNLKF